MSTNLINKDTGELVTLANGTRMWIGTQSAHDLAVQQGTMPNNCMVCITDDAPGEEAWQYSTDETRTGKTWIDGKPIYRKVVEFGVLPNNTEKTVSHGISNIDTIIEPKCIAKATSGTQIQISFTSSPAYFYTSNSNIVINSNSDMSPFSAYAILEYTKTTD